MFHGSCVSLLATLRAYKLINHFIPSWFIMKTNKSYKLVLHKKGFGGSGKQVHVA